MINDQILEKACPWIFDEDLPKGLEEVRLGIIEEIRARIFEKEKGKKEGKVELLLRIAAKNGSLPKYEQALASVKTLAELESLEDQIIDEFCQRRRGGGVKALSANK